MTDMALIKAVSGTYQLGIISQLSISTTNYFGLFYQLII